MIKMLNSPNKRCCATCSIWFARDKNAAYCPVVDYVFGQNDDMTCFACSDWVLEKRESFAVDLYKQLGGKL